jgi:hypothetical protein
MEVSLAKRLRIERGLQVLLNSRLRRDFPDLYTNKCVRMPFTMAKFGSLEQILAHLPNPRACHRSLREDKRGRSAQGGQTEWRRCRNGSVKGEIGIRGRSRASYMALRGIER